jgi:hypothetical protein
MEEVQRLDESGLLPIHTQCVCDNLRYSPIELEEITGSCTIGVITHLPNELALKMDGAKVLDRCLTIKVNAKP